MRRESGGGGGVKECQMEKTGSECFQNQTEESAPESKTLPESQQQRRPEQSGKLNTKPTDAGDEAEGGGGGGRKTKPPHKHD
ncbi:leucine zipper protein 2-like [Stegastes partitus]|uniref:Leucine zipper protein 2-like n=1 Tax=Stegastes partitus TaxID=144197 RepID=A0A9Y4TU58_9TELE|nr:PREDICTED: leucine zipper protein 2-like [Stegastes partitus]